MKTWTLRQLLIGATAIMALPVGCLSPRAWYPESEVEKGLFIVCVPEPSAVESTTDDWHRFHCYLGNGGPYALCLAPSVCSPYTDFNARDGAFWLPMYRSRGVQQFHYKALFPSADMRAEITKKGNLVFTNEPPQQVLSMLNFRTEVGMPALVLTGVVHDLTISVEMIIPVLWNGKETSATVKKVLTSEDLRMFHRVGTTASDEAPKEQAPQK